MLEGILWFFRSDARWQDLPEKYPHLSTCWRLRVPDWEEQDVWLSIWRAFLNELNERDQLKRSESFLDSSLAPAKKVATEPEKPSGAGGRSRWWWPTAKVFLWETTFTLHSRRKSGLQKRRPTPSCGPAAPEAGAGDCRQRSRQLPHCKSDCGSGASN